MQSVRLFFEIHQLKKLPIPLPILYCFELIQVTVTDEPVGVLPLPNSNSSELLERYRLVIPGNYESGKLPMFLGKC